MATPRVAKSDDEGSPGKITLCCSYLRISTTGQEDGYGLEIQRSQIESFLKSNPTFKLVASYQDIASGATVSRPQLQNLLADARQRKFSKVLCYRMDRISRDLYTGLWIEKELLVHGVEVLSISESCNGNSPLEKAMRAMVQCFSALERDTITLRLLSGRRKRLAENKFAGGSVPYGYRLRDGKFVIEPKAAEVVRLIFKLRRSGLTYEKLAEELTRRKIKAPSGGNWKPGSLYYTCNNKTYFGALKYGETQPNAHDAIIREGGH